MSFDQFGIDQRCLRVLKTQGITEPTPIQAQAVPVALEGAGCCCYRSNRNGQDARFCFTGADASRLLAGGPQPHARDYTDARTRPSSQRGHRTVL